MLADVNQSTMIRRLKMLVMVWSWLYVPHELPDNNKGKHAHDRNVYRFSATKGASSASEESHLDDESRLLSKNDKRKKDFMSSGVSPEEYQKLPTVRRLSDVYEGQKRNLGRCAWLGGSVDRLQEPWVFRLWNRTTVNKWEQLLKWSLRSGIVI